MIISILERLAPCDAEISVGFVPATHDIVCYAFMFSIY